MEKIKAFMVVFITIFIIIFLVHYFIITKPQLKSIFVESKKTKKKKKVREITELNYLVNKFHLNKEKLNWKQLAIAIPFINSFIMALVVAIMEIIPLSIVWVTLIAFVLLFALIYSLYEIYGRYLKHKQERERD